MPLRAWRKIAEETLFRNPWWTYRRDDVTLPNGKPGEYHYVHTNGSSLIIPVMADGQILTVNQYRYLARRESIEFPCGAVKDGADYETTARHELAEETGYEAGTLEIVGEFNPYNGVTDEICRVHIARNLRHVGSSPDETEEFELVPLSAGEIDAKISSGEIWDGMTIAAWQIARGLVAVGTSV